MTTSTRPLPLADVRILAGLGHRSLDVSALDEAARRGFANGAFEELEEDVPALVEEFYPDAEQGEPGRAQPAPPPALRARLQEKVARLGTG